MATDRYGPLPSRRAGHPWHVVAGVLAAVAVLAGVAGSALAAGAWNGQDLYFVPMSWCVVGGSPADANPNVAGDTDTDAILWRRHERPTDNIFIGPAGISLRSAINNAWGTFNFPVINDPATAQGATGDVRGENVNTNGIEFNQVINDCDAAYVNLGRAGIGITAVNAGLFHDGGGDYVGVLGWGGCVEFPAGTCVTPFDGRIMVIDNRFLHPSVADRTFPPSPADPGGNLMFPLTDSLDQLTGHEVGHALSLDHRNDPTALMNPGPVDNDGDGDTDNIGLNAAEIAALRANVLNVPGLEIDPPGQFDPGRFVATRMVDQTRENPEAPAHLDLASVRASLDKEDARVMVDLQLMDTLPENGRPLNFWYLLDVDGPQRGFTDAQLRRLRVPRTEFRGADLIGRVLVRGRQAIGETFVLEGEEIVQVGRDRVAYQLLTLVMHPYVTPLSGDGGQAPRDVPTPVHDIVRLDVPHEIARVELGRPFAVHALVTTDGAERVADRLSADGDREGIEFVLDDPSFPHCYPDLSVTPTPGRTLPIELEGLLPGAPIHGLLGPELVFNGHTDADGGGVIDFPVPANAAPGYHLITVGVDGTALTADCTILVEKPGASVPDDPTFELLRSHEDLLRRQQMLLDHLAGLIRDLAARDDLPPERLLGLTERYAELTARQQELLAAFEELVRAFDP